MTRVTYLYIGAVLSSMAAFGGLVIVPHIQLGRLEPIEHIGTDPYPLEPSGLEQTGAAVYRSLGCIYCHTQQVRTDDVERGWGDRRTVPRDYLHDRPAQLGTMRTGPDLANIGIRQPSADWHYLHLYEPQRTSPDSTMPPHRFLFERVGIAKDSHDKDLIPTDDAHALVAYLTSLRRNTDVPEVR